MFGSYVMSSCFRTPGKVKARNKIWIVTWICKRYIFLISNYSPTALFRPRCKCKGNLHISKFIHCAFEELPPDLQLEVINLKFKDKLNINIKMIKENYKLLFSNKYTQLKLCAHAFISVFGITYLDEKTYSIK